MSPDLETIVNNVNRNNPISINIIMKEQFDAQALNQMVNGLPKKVRRAEVVRILKQFSQEKQKSITEYLNLRAGDNAVSDIQPLWIVNVIHCLAKLDVILELNNNPNIWFIDYDLLYAPNLEQVPVKIDITGTDAITWGLRKIHAPEVWALGYTGTGIIAGMIDTGVNYNHLDLADHMWTDPNYPNYGWNFESNNNNPIDISGHGSHTAGTVAADGTAGTQCGVAPDCQIMALRVRTQADSIAENQVWQAFQFVISPPLSPEHGADFISMSLGWWLSWSPRQALWRTSCNNVGAAGIPMAIAAGNERQYVNPPNSCRCPGNCPPPWWNPQNTGTGALSNVISIGATDSTDMIAGFSSPGPCTWQSIAPFNDYAYPPGLTRPDVSGPGVDVISCSYNQNNGYVPLDGTSMATPHTGGTIALMLQKNPELLPWQVDSILEVTAIDLGPAGKDNDYGAGCIDALNAVNYTQLPGGVRPLRNIIIDDSPGNSDGIINPGEGIEMPLWVMNRTGREIQGLRGILRLSTADPNVSITDSVKYFGSIAIGDSGYTGPDGFNFTVSVACTNAYPLPFELVCIDTLDSIWSNSIGLRVGTPVLLGDEVNVIDSAPWGNNNDTLDPGEIAFLEIGLQNLGLGNGYDVTAHLISTDGRLEVLDSIGTYGIIFHDTTIFNSVDQFQVSAHNSILPETNIQCTLRIYASGYPVQNKLYFIKVGRLTTTDPIPDGPRIPPLFWAYDNTDNFYTNCPTYEWVEISGVGTQLNFSQNDDVLLVTLPAAFGPVKFYGSRYTNLSVSADGFVVFGNNLTERYHNFPIPTDSLTAFIALNWDDLYPNYSGSGYVYHYHDVANHRFIIEYDSVPYYSSTNIMDKFELIIYDTTVVTPNGDNILVAQYQTANGYSSSTVGIQDPTQDIGIQYLYNGSYHQGAAPIIAGRAIKYITGDPIASVIESDSKGPTSINAFRLEPCSPNPFGAKTTIRYNLPKPGLATLRIYNTAGRLVKTLVNREQNTGSYSITWDGKDLTGKKVTSGVYFYSLTHDKLTITHKMLLVQ
jgi:serine protease AprX